MAFSTRTITHKFINPDGTPGSGVVEFALLKQMTNSGTTILPGVLLATIASDGTLSQAVTTNTDTGTFPADAQYRIDIRLQASGATTTSFVVQIPAGSGSLDLGSLLPQAEQQL